MAGAQHLPLARTAQTLADLLGTPVSVGTVAAILAQAGSGLGGFTEAVRAQLSGAGVVHFGAGRVAGGRPAGVGALGEHPTLRQITVRPRRGIEAMDAAGVLGGFCGVAVHDGWKPYRHYDRDPATAGASCTACATPTTCANSRRSRRTPRTRPLPPGLRGRHPARQHRWGTDTALAPSGSGQAWAAGLARLLVEIHRTAGAGRTAGATELSAPLLASYLGRYDTLITAGHAANPPTAGRRKSKEANLLARLTPSARTSCGSRPTGPCRSTTSPSATSGWSRSARRSADAYAPTAEQRGSAPCAVTCPPPASKATTPWTSYANSPTASPGSPTQEPAEQLPRFTAGERCTNTAAGGSSSQPEVSSAAGLVAAHAHLPS